MAIPYAELFKNDEVGLRADDGRTSPPTTEHSWDEMGCQGVCRRRGG